MLPVRASLFSGVFWKSGQAAWNAANGEDHYARNCGFAFTIPNEWMQRN
jgi:hypothetical protein